jgi:hypothetical protein
MAGVAPASVFPRIELPPVRRLVAVRARVFRLEAEFGDAAGRQEQGRPSGYAGALVLLVARDARRRPMGTF